MSKRPHPPTIVFDLDGTLVDTVQDIAAALDRALAPYGCGLTRPEEAASMMGEGLSGFFWRALVAKRLDLPADQAIKTYKRFLNAYRQAPVRHSQMYPGIKALLEDLREAGAHTAVCTNKVEDIALQILEQLHILDLFDAVVGHRGDRPKKPDPLTLLEAIALAGGRRERALMVGDTGADSSAAIAAGIPAILVSYGYSPVQVRALSTDVHVDSVAELRNEVLQFMATGDRRIRSRASLR
jgi:phosphoglycolate phosphatase